MTRTLGHYIDKLGASGGNFGEGGFVKGDQILTHWGPDNMFPII